jgi:putative FmdB family regulatory protein
MPTYEYECEKCKKRFEIFQSIKEHPIAKCPNCRGKMQRLISSGSGIIFKGKGFYATDYRSKDYKQKQREEKNISCPKSCPNCPKAEK